MSRFIAESNLPQGKVASLICGGLNDEIISYFLCRGIDILFTEKKTTVDPAVSRHCDLYALYLGDGKIILDREQTELAVKLEAEGFNVLKTQKSVNGEYPNDCILNHTLIGKHIIGNSRIFDGALMKECADYEVIHTNQGYCKCSILVVDENSVITDDVSIAHNCRENGFDCLLVSKGDIFLNKHEYGFIGGASGKISKNEIVFFGDITKHRDYYPIKSFIYDRGMKIISFNFPLTDFGGIVPIKENF